MRGSVHPTGGHHRHSSTPVPASEFSAVKREQSLSGSDRKQQTGSSVSSSKYSHAMSDQTSETSRKELLHRLLNYLSNSSKQNRLTYQEPTQQPLQSASLRIKGYNPLSSISESDDNSSARLEIRQVELIRSSSVSARAYNLLSNVSKSDDNPSVRLRDYVGRINPLHSSSVSVRGYDRPNLANSDQPNASISDQPVPKSDSSPAELLHTMMAASRARILQEKEDTEQAKRSGHFIMFGPEGPHIVKM